MSKISNTEIGIWWEEAVLRFLQGTGYTLLAKRFKIKNAEIDIIAKQENIIAFIEVKYRKTFEDFEGIVTHSKLKLIFSAHEAFLEQNYEFKNLEPRFDIIFISKDLSLNHITNISL